MTISAEQLTEPLAYHGEGPVWSESWPGLRFVDMLAGDVLTVDVAGLLLERRHVGDVAACVRPRTAGGLVIGVERGFALVDADGTFRRLPPVWDDTGVRMNEGGCDPAGAFFCGSMAFDQSPGRGRLYRLDPDGSVGVVLTGVGISNGLGWSPDHALAYYVDTPTGRVDVFDWDPDRGLHDRRGFVEVDEADGHPDGLTVDADGGVWVALYGGSAVRRYSPDGSIDETVELPVSKVTACTFGGPGLRDLFVTTSREDVPDDEQPQAGSVFRARPGVTGLPVLPFAG